MTDLPSSELWVPSWRAGNPHIPLRKRLKITWSHFPSSSRTAIALASCQFTHGRDTRLGPPGRSDELRRRIARSSPRISGVSSAALMMSWSGCPKMFREIHVPCEKASMMIFTMMKPWYLVNPKIFMIKTCILYGHKSNARWWLPKIGVPLNHPLNRNFHYKPSILGYPYFRKPPYETS